MKGRKISFSVIFMSGTIMPSQTMSKETTKIGIKLRIKEEEYLDARQRLAAINWEKYPQFKEPLVTGEESEFSIQIKMLLTEGVLPGALTQFIESELEPVKGIEYQGVTALPKEKI